MPRTKRLAKAAKKIKSAITKAVTPAAGKDVDVEGVLSGGAAGAGGDAPSLMKRLLNWKTVLGVGGTLALTGTIEKLVEKHGIPADLKGKSRAELEDLLSQSKAHRDPPLTRAIEEVAGLDRQMLLEREIASQAPPGTAPASPFVDRELRKRMAMISPNTPIVDRIQVLNPDLLGELRKRMASAAGGLWSDLAAGEILIDGNQAPPSRAQEAADNQQLEVTLREELGFRRKTPIDVDAMMA